jgi:hypothetical protein
MTITTDFTLFNVAMINPITMERIEQGDMRARDAKAFVEKMDARGIPTMVTSYSESDTLSFTEYMIASKLTSPIVPSSENT